MLLQFEESVNQYREAISAWEEYKDRLHTDSLQVNCKLLIN